MPTPIGVIELTLQGEQVRGIDLFVRQRNKKVPSLNEQHPVYRGLQQYFRDPACPPAVAVEYEGTPFQKRVWRALQGIPAGETRTYGDLARKLDTSARAVGNACRANPVPLVVPCHRVVARTGLGGFAGERQGGRTAIKKWLLEHERGLRH